MVKQDRLRASKDFLGKLPPQAPEMEEAVLGGLLLEKTAYSQVCQFLQPEHFYDDRHKEIYQAITDLSASSTPIDMRTVSNQLRKTGKLEIVGNSFYIAEITAKVSSAANITTHARVIVEMAVKRSAILIASEIQSLGYNDTQDAFELITRALAKFDAVRKNTVSEDSESRIKALWEKTLITNEPPPETPMIEIDGVVMGTLGNHGLIVGKKKSRKSLFIVLVIAQAILQGKVKPEEVILFDTEQGRRHVYNMRHKIFLLTGHYIATFFLRGQSPQERRDFIASTLKHWPNPVKLTVNDGIRDLMTDINDTEESTSLIQWIESLTNQHMLFMVNVLHLNKTDSNPRGHIGTELLNKAQFTIELELDDKTNTTMVKCESQRDLPFDAFGLVHGAAPDYLPEVVGAPLKGSGGISNDDRRVRLCQAFEDGPLTYASALNEIKTSFGVGTNRAGTLLKDFQRLGWVVKSGEAHNKDTVYKLMITNPTQIQPPITPPEDRTLSEDEQELPF
jgi:hypothetical protein